MCPRGGLTYRAHRKPLSTEQETPTARTGAPALSLGREQKTSVTRVEPGAAFQARRGTIAHEALTRLPRATQISTHLGDPLSPAAPLHRSNRPKSEAEDPERFPECPGYVLSKLNIAHGHRAVEADAGSQGLTFGFAYAVRPTGRLVSCEAPLEMEEVGRENLECPDLAEHIACNEGDIGGFIEQRGVGSSSFEGAHCVAALFRRPTHCPAAASPIL